MFSPFFFVGHSFNQLVNLVNQLVNLVNHLMNLRICFVDLLIQFAKSILKLDKKNLFQTLISLYYQGFPRCFAIGIWFEYY